MTGIMGTVTRPDDGSVEWHAHTFPALGPVMVSWRDVVVSVDPTEPAQVISIVAAGVESLMDSAGDLFDGTAIGEIIGAAPGANCPGPYLSDGVVHLATVSAVHQLYVGDLDESILFWDRAQAHLAGGQIREADRLYRLGMARIERMVDQIDVDQITGPLVERLVDMIRTAPQAVFGPELRDDLLGRLAEQSIGQEPLWQRLFGQARVLPLASTLGSPGAEAGELADLRRLPPRLLAFTDPEDPEIDVDFDDDRVTVSAQLRPDVETSSSEVRELFAVAADSESGRLIAAAPCTVESSRVIATMYVPDVPITGIRCAVVTRLDDDAIMDALAASMVSIDRHCRHAWTCHRLAGSVRADAGITSSSAQIEVREAEAIRLLAAAHHSMDVAQQLAARLRRRYRRDDRADVLDQYGDAVQRLAVRLEQPPFIDGPLGPTVAELAIISLGGL